MMTDYPPGSVGGAFQKVERSVEALPWYHWPLKVRLRRSLKESRRRMSARRNQFLADFLDRPVELFDEAEGIKPLAHDPPLLEQLAQRPQHLGQVGAVQRQRQVRLYW